MEKKENKSILKEALSDYNAIMEAADNNAKKKLAEEFPNKFNELLKEEVKNKKNKSEKEPYKEVGEVNESAEVEESDVNKKSVMENQTKKAEYAKKAKVGDSSPYGEKEKNVYKDKAETAEQNKTGEAVIDVNNQGREKDFAGDVEAKTPNLDKDGAKGGDPFKQKTKTKNTNAKENVNLTEEFDITELGDESVDNALDSLSEDDEVITLDDIESEISEMENLTKEIEEPLEGPNTNQYQELVDMKNKIDEMLKNMPGGVVEEEKVDEHHLNTKEEKIDFIAGLDDEMIDNLYRSAEEQLGMVENDELSITDDEIDNVFGDEEIDEVKINTHSAQKHVSNELTQDDILQNRKRYAQQDVRESEVKFKGLLNENKKLTKKVNEVNKFKKSTTKLIENYKLALEKYRNQLKEMAVFNTNLAHVNNLLVNEELALTQNDKVNIINEFKKVKSISESQNSYKNMLTEMKKGKKRISESIEDKVSSSIQPSSKKKLDEAVEKTAYENNEHINKIKGLIEYVEKRGKKTL